MPDLYTNLVKQDYKGWVIDKGEVGFWRRKWQPTPAFLPGKFHELRSLSSYSPWGGKESDMT